VTRRRVLLAAALAFASYAMIAVIWFAHTGGFGRTAHAGAERFFAMTAKLGFKTRYVYVEGRKDTPLQDITDAIDVQPGEPILAVSVEDIHARVTALPRIRSATVERVLPDQLIVHITEREPVAIWQWHDRLQLLDADGVVMPETNVGKPSDLPLLVGEGVPQHIGEVLALLQSEPELAKSMRAAVRVGDRRWNILFANDLELKLPEDGAQEAWHRFARMDREQHLMSRDVNMVDMRLNDRIYVKSSTPPPVPKPTISAVGSKDT
jgi:cell division protein FtsQ